MANRIWLATADGNWGTAANWSGSAVPVAGDTVFIPAGTPAITAGLNQSGVALAAVEFQYGYGGTVGSSSAYLQLNCTSLKYAGGGLAYIDLGSAAITPTVTAAAVGSVGGSGLYLKGSALTGLAVSGGTVALAGLPGETSSATDIRCSGNGTILTLGAGVTATTVTIYAGTLNVGCAFTTANVYGGTFNHTGSGAATTVNVYAGTCNLYSSGNITNTNIYGGVVDTLGLAVARTHSNVKLGAGGSFTRDPALLTVTTWVSPGQPIRLQATAA